MLPGDLREGRGQNLPAQEATGDLEGDLLATKRPQTSGTFVTNSAKVDLKILIRPCQPHKAPTGESYFPGDHIKPRSNSAQLDSIKRR